MTDEIEPLLDARSEFGGGAAIAFVLRALIAAWHQHKKAVVLDVAGVRILAAKRHRHEEDMNVERAPLAPDGQNRIHRRRSAECPVVPRRCDVSQGEAV